MNRNTANVCQMHALSDLFYLAPYGKAFSSKHYRNIFILTVFYLTDNNGGTTF